MRLDRRNGMKVSATNEYFKINALGDTGYIQTEMKKNNEFVKKRNILVWIKSHWQYVLSPGVDLSMAFILFCAL